MGGRFRSVGRAVHMLQQNDEPGLQIHVRECRPKGPERPDGAILFVHGATFASSIWDIALPGMSFLEGAAAAGMAAYALDIRGYARSRSDAMAAAATPYARAIDALRDIDLVTDFIRAREDRERIVIAGGSWGSITSGSYAAGPGRDKLCGVILHAPIFAEANPGWMNLIADPVDPARPNPALRGYRLVNQPEARVRWDAELPPASRSAFRDEAVLEAMMGDEAIAQPLPDGGRGPVLQVPNGALLDLFEAFSQRPLYDPAAIAMPAMLVRGSLDTTSTRTDALALFDRLGTPAKRYVEIGHGSHFVGAERQAWQLQDVILDFAGSVFSGKAGAF